MFNTFTGKQVEQIKKFRNKYSYRRKQKHTKKEGEKKMNEKTARNSQFSKKPSEREH
jgi:hypothetical protein